MVDYENITSDEILDTIFEESGTDEILENLFDGEHNKEAALVYLNFLKLCCTEAMSEEKPEYIEQTLVLLTKFMVKFARSKSFTEDTFEKYLDLYLATLSACVDDYPSIFPKIQPYLKSLFMTTKIS